MEPLQLHRELPCEERFFHRRHVVKSEHHTSITVELQRSVRSTRLGVTQTHDQSLSLYWREHRCSVAAHISRHVHCVQHNATHARTQVSKDGQHSVYISTIQHRILLTSTVGVLASINCELWFAWKLELKANSILYWRQSQVNDDHQNQVKSLFFRLLLNTSLSNDNYK